jgi:hypothetical protein
MQVWLVEFRETEMAHREKLLTGMVLSERGEVRGE